MILGETIASPVFPIAKVEKILKGSLHSTLSPSVKIQIMGGKVCLRYKGIVNKLLKTKSLLTTPSNVFAFIF